MLNRKLKQFLHDKNIHLLSSSELHGSSYYCEANGIPFIIYNEKLSDEELEEAIIHELGHHFNDDDTMINYKIDSIVRDKSEHGANKYLVETYAKKYVEDVDKENANYLSLANFLNMNDIDMVRDILKLKYKLDMPRQ